MLKIINELEKLGLELTDEQKESIKKSIGEEVYSKLEHEKKVEKIETERDGFKERAETAEETLKGFDGKDLETITRERDEWKQKAELAEKLPEAVVTPLEGTYLCWINLEAYVSADEMKEVIQKKCRLAVDFGDWFGGERFGTFIRMNLATSKENVEIGVNALIMNLMRK